MANRGMIVLGSILIGFGVLFLLGTLLNINIWALCWPVLLIVVGVWFAFRPQLPGGVPSEIFFIGDMKRRGMWAVRNVERWVFVGDFDLDFSQAEIPVGETRLRFFGFVNEVKMYIPENVGVVVETAGFLNDINLYGRRFENIMSPVQFQSDHYQETERKLRIEMVSFVANLKVKQA